MNTNRPWLMVLRTPYLEAATAIAQAEFDFAYAIAADARANGKRQTAENELTHLMHADA